MFATVLLSLVLVQTLSPIAMDTGSISGNVVDAASQTPVAGARVTLVRIVEADVLPGDYFVIPNPSVESSLGGGVGAFAIGFGVETVAGSDPVVVFDTPSGRQPVEIRVTEANVTGVRVVTTP